MGGSSHAQKRPRNDAQRELPNLRAALKWTFDEDELELALRLAVAASWGWALNSAYTEGRDWVSRALDETEHLQTLERAQALFWLAEFAGWQGDFRSAKTFNERARALFEEHHDQIGVFRSLLGLTEFEVSLGDLERARGALEKAGTLADGLASDDERAQLCFKGAQVEGLAGDYERARRWSRRDSSSVASSVCRGGNGSISSSTSAGSLCSSTTSTAQGQRSRSTSPKTPGRPRAGSRTRTATSAWSRYTKVTPTTPPCASDGADARPRRRPEANDGRQPLTAWRPSQRSMATSSVRSPVGRRGRHQAVDGLTTFNPGAAGHRALSGVGAGRAPR